MLEWVRFVAVLPVDFWCCEGVLFIKTGLSAEKKAAGLWKRSFTWVV